MVGYNWLVVSAPLKNIMGSVNLSLTTYLEALARSQLHAAHRRCWINLAKGPLSLSLRLPLMKTFVGLWVPARVFPERTSNLECGLSVGLVVSTELSILVGGA